MGGKLPRGTKLPFRGIYVQLWHHKNNTYKDGNCPLALPAMQVSGWLWLTCFAFRLLPRSGCSTAVLINYSMLQPSQASLKLELLFIQHNQLIQSTSLGTINKMFHKNIKGSTSQWHWWDICGNWTGTRVLLTQWIFGLCFQAKNGVHISFGPSVADVFWK